MMTLLLTPGHFELICREPIPTAPEETNSMNSSDPTSVRRTALVIAHEPDGPGGQVAVRLAERGFDVTTHVVTHDYDKPNEATPFPSFADYDLVALMGSIRSLTRKHEIDSWIHDELAQIRAAHAADQPMIGVCFGGQLLADALGGSVEESPVTEIGWHPIEAADGGSNPVGPGPWMEWHHDRFTPPPGAKLLAETESAAQIFAIGRSVGTQFHPEVDVAHITGWLQTADDEYLAENGQDRHTIIAEINEHEARNTAQCHALVDWYLDTVAFPDDAQEPA